MTLSEFQGRVSNLYATRGYTSEPLTIALIVCEEAGEVAGAVNNTNPQYKQKPGRTQDTLEHELKDLLVAVAALACASGISLEQLVWKWANGEVL